MSDKPPAQTVTAADIEKSIQALSKMAERLWGDGREAEAKALLDALDALNRALDRIRIGENRRTLHCEGTQPWTANRRGRITPRRCR